jgi:hypothetical protein
LDLTASNNWLVVLTILKILVNGMDYPIYEMENEKCLKPLTRNGPLDEWQE